MSELLSEYLNGREAHFSAGVWLYYDDGIVMVERKKIPYGFAAPAGHVDVGESYEQAMLRETIEETGLQVTSHELLFQDRIVYGNSCSRGVDTHIWRVFVGRGEGKLERAVAESDSLEVYPLDAVKDMYQRGTLEPVWKTFVDEYGLIDRHENFVNLV